MRTYYGPPEPIGRSHGCVTPTAAHASTSRWSHFVESSAGRPNDPFWTRDEFQQATPGRGASNEGIWLSARVVRLSFCSENAFVCIMDFDQNYAKLTIMNRVNICLPFSIKSWHKMLHICIIICVQSPLNAPFLLVCRCTGCNSGGLLYWSQAKNSHILLDVILVFRKVSTGIMGRWWVERRLYGAFMVFMVILVMLRGFWAYLGGTAWYLVDLGWSGTLYLLFDSSWGFRGKLQCAEGCECADRRVFWVMFVFIGNVEVLLGGSIYMHISNTPASHRNCFWIETSPRGQITFLAILWYDGNHSTPPQHLLCVLRVLPPCRARCPSIPPTYCGPLALWTTPVRRIALNVDAWARHAVSFFPCRHSGAVTARMCPLVATIV